MSAAEWWPFVISVICKCKASACIAWLDSCVGLADCVLEPDFFWERAIIRDLRTAHTSFLAFACQNAHSKWSSSAPASCTSFDLARRRCHTMLLGCSMHACMHNLTFLIVCRSCKMSMHANAKDDFHSTGCNIPCAAFDTATATSLRTLPQVATTACIRSRAATQSKNGLSMIAHSSERDRILAASCKPGQHASALTASTADSMCPADWVEGDWPTPTGYALQLVTKNYRTAPDNSESGWSTSFRD